MNSLEKINAYMPQLEYVVKCWDVLLGGYGYHMAIQFENHYNGHHVRNIDKYQSYLDDVATQIVLKAYGIDPEKFWYLLLMAMDYTDYYGTDFVMNQAPSTQLKKVFSLINENLQVRDIPALGFEFAHDQEMKLTLTVKEEGKKRNTVVNIDTPNAFAYLIGLAMEYAPSLIKKDDDTDDSNVIYSGSIGDPIWDMAIGGTFDEQPSIPQTEKLACFTYILMAFLKPLKVIPGITTRDFSRNKYYLVSQYAYMMGITSDTAFIDDLNPNYLKNYIKHLDYGMFYNSNRFYTCDFVDE